MEKPNLLPASPKDPKENTAAARHLHGWINPPPTFLDLHQTPCMPSDNPQEQGITVAPLNVEVRYRSA